MVVCIKFKASVVGVQVCVLRATLGLLLAHSLGVTSDSLAA